MEFKSIYRTYRPQTWEDLQGQELIVRTLTNAIAHEALAHAYLFTGPRGVGKTTTARLLAKALNCEKRKKGAVNPCNRCRSCEEIRDGRSLDVLEIDAASHTGVDHVRENIIAASRVASFEQKKKVFIIDEVHMLSLSAFNALLKTLEEPPAHVFFVLATTEVDRVPETIISRCQRFDFRRMKHDDIVRRLSMIAKKEGVEVAPEILRDLARHAEGGMRDAESMLGQLLALGKKHITEEEAALLLPRGDRVRAETFVRALLERKTRDALAVLQDFLDTGGDIDAFVKDCLTVVREALLDTLQKKEHPLSHDHKALSLLLRGLVRAASECTTTEPPELPLELLIAEYVDEESEDDDEKGGGETEKKEEKPAKGGSPSARAGASASLTLAVIQEKWDTVVLASKKYNHSLALILKVATPLSVEGQTVTLGFRHSFHVERLEKRDHQELTAKVFEEVCGQPCTVKGKVIALETTSGAEKGGDSLLHSILETFGGEVVKA